MSGAAQGAGQRGRKRGSGALVAWPLIAALLGAAAWLGVAMLAPDQPSFDVPLPQSEDVVADGTGDPGPDCFSTPCPVENADTGGGEGAFWSAWAGTPVTEMSVEGMAPGSVFLPSALAYAEMLPTEEFHQSRYAGMLEITIPDNPRRGFLHSAGAPLSAGTGGMDASAVAELGGERPGSSQGVTMTGTHAGYDGLWGAFVHLGSLSGDETVWTKDFDGTVTRWQVSRVHSLWHTEFPQGYWSAEGPRTLVLTACGGPAGEMGQYTHNVFVEAVPVELDGSPWQVKETEDRIQAREAMAAERVAPGLRLVEELLVQQRIAAEAAEEAARLAEEEEEEEEGTAPASTAPASAVPSGTAQEEQR